MRSAPALAMTLVPLLAACAGTRTPRVGAGGPAGEPLATADGVAPAAPRAPAPPVELAGPMDAADLARATGLSVTDEGASVLLSGTALRARFYPGADRMTLDGRTLAMGEVARREGSHGGAGFVVPAEGVRLVRQGMREARARDAALASAYPTTPIYRPAPPPPTVAVLAPPKALVKPVEIEAGAGWVPTCAERAWRYVVVHHSDDTAGCCSKYDKIHRGKGWENGCGYHFVIGNGSMSADGQVEVGPRWVSQIQGAHAKTPDNRFNEEGVGIVLVGDFEHGPGPSRTQYEAAVHLTRWLMARYHIPPDRVLRHQDAKATACPGKNFPWAHFLQDVSAAPAVATPP